SIQRRHQKVLEESPAPGVSADLRNRLASAAVGFGKTVAYRSAGTAEFMVDGEEFFFLELNGRIQVEHPVTEGSLGIDLVAKQLDVAAGASVTGCNSAVGAGHAVEARLYAADPVTFLPQTGTVARLCFPEGIRVDAGFEEGDEIGIAYDPMIAKLIAHGETRDEAFERLRLALAETEAEGVITNLPFLRWLVAHSVV